MALDKVVDSDALDTGMHAVADAIRAKAGTTEQLSWPDGFISAIEAISGGGGGGFTYITTFTPTATGYASYYLFDSKQLALKPSYNSGIFVSRGNTDLSSDTGNAILLVLYTANRYLAIALGSYNNTLQSAYVAPADRSESGIGVSLGVASVGNTRSGYLIVGKQYNVYEIELNDNVASRIIDYTEETS